MTGWGRGGWARSVALSVVAATGVGTGCGGDEASGPVEVPPVWTLAPEPELRVGLQEGPPELLFERILAVRLLEGGGIAVADQGASTVRVFGADGSRVAEMGGEGDGPGEIRYLSGFQVMGRDTLVVYDPDTRRLTRFGTDGQLLGTDALRDQGPDSFLGRTSTGDWLMRWVDQEAFDRTASAPAADPMVIGRFGPDGSFQGIAGRHPGMVRQRNESFSGPVPFSPFPHAVVLRDSLVVTNGARPRLDVLGDSGRVVRTIEVPLANPDRERARRALDSVFAEGPAERRERAARLPEAGWELPVPAIAQVLLGPDHRLWLKAFDPARDSWMTGGGFGRASGGRWLVVDPQGEAVATVDLPSDLRPTDIGRDRIAGVETDELGVERAVVYEVRR